MKQHALVSYLRKTLGTSVRAAGFLGLVKDSCRGCSAYPDNIEPAMHDVGEVIDRINKLVEMLVEGEREES